MPERQTLGNLVSLRLQELGLSQAKAAERGGINPSIVSRIASGKIANPGDVTLGKLAEVLQVEFDVLDKLRVNLGTSQQQEPKALIPQKVWALCIVLEQVEEKSIEEILLERIQCAFSGRSEKIKNLPPD